MMPKSSKVIENSEKNLTYVTHDKGHTAPSFLCDLTDYHHGVGVFYGHIAPTQFREHVQPKIEIALPLDNAYGPATWQTATGSQATQWLRAGHTSIIPANQPHAATIIQEADVLMFYLDPAFILHAIQHRSATNSFEVVEAITAEDLFIQQLALALRTELQAAALPGRLYIESVSIVLVAHLLQHYSVQKISLHPLPGNVSRRALQQAIDYIHDHLSEDLTLSEVANVLAISPSHFAHTFKQALGQTPHQYILHCRIEQAKQLLRSSELTIGQVATRVGFHDQSHFTHCFKRMLNTTPIAFLREVRKN